MEGTLGRRTAHTRAAVLHRVLTGCDAIVGCSFAVGDGVSAAAVSSGEPVKV